MRPFSGVTYVLTSLNFKACRFAYNEEEAMSLLVFYYLRFSLSLCVVCHHFCCPMLQGHVACCDFTLTGPQECHGSFCIYLCFSGTNQKPEWRRPFGTGLVRHCSQGLFSPFFTFLRSIYIFPPV